MSAHIIIHIDVETPEDLKAYQALARPTMADFGIRLVAKTPKVETLEGESPGNMLVLLEADSVEQARAWYASDGYREAIQARDGIARFTTTVIA